MTIFVIPHLLTGRDNSHLIQRPNLHVDRKVPTLGPLSLGTTTPITKSSAPCYLELLKALNCYEEWMLIASKSVYILHRPNKLTQASLHCSSQLVRATIRTYTVQQLLTQEFNFY